MREFSAELLDALSASAKESPRLRKHLNIHTSYSETCQRLFNAIEVGSYIRPHRHMVDQKTESMIAVRGTMMLVTFRNEGEVLSAVRFGIAADCKGQRMAAGVEVPPGIWHTVIALEPGSILFEVKAGPFDPDLAKEYAPWAPEEGSLKAGEYQRRLMALLHV